MDPNARLIIDCTEVNVETPSCLEVQATLWSDYKQHCTVKFLVAITPNGLICWLSPAYGGRASDVHIVRDSGFLRVLEPGDQIMADRGFKIKTNIATIPAKLCIPPSAQSGVQMTENDVVETSRVANLRIYIEQAIQRIKVYEILSSRKLPLLLLPIFNDIQTVIAALCNLQGPLCQK